VFLYSEATGINSEYIYCIKTGASKHSYLLLKYCLTEWIPRYSFEHLHITKTNATKTKL